jgi:tetratricopeptide (TPR) repeat protein
MKSKGKTGAVRKETAGDKRAGANQQPIGLYAAAGLAVMVFFWAYAPVMHAAFLFDDKQLFGMTESTPLRAWIGAVRPVLMTTYWFNSRMAHGDTYSYHVVNLLIHTGAAALVFLIVRRLAEWAEIDPKKRGLLSGFAAILFLLHPAQTESVAYIAGRSESLSGLFAVAAFAVFLYRRSGAISWSRVIAVVLLAMAAMLSKEQAVVLFAVFLLTDYWWNPGYSLQGIKRNWRLYVPLLAGAAAAVMLFAKMIMGIGTGGSAGFGMKDFTWYQYLFTQFRAIWIYIIHFVLPVNLNLDWDFSISHSILEHGAIFGLIGLLGLAVAAWVMRKQFRLAAYGYFLFLLLLAPTSSILPIKDPVADRRMYLPTIGLLLIAVDFASRLKVERKALVGGCAVLAALAAATTRARADVWGDPISIWEDTVRKSPEKSRPHFQLGYAYSEQQRFDRAIAEFERAAALQKPDYDLLVDWGLAYDGLHQPEKALAKFREAAAQEPTAHAYTQIAKVYAEQSQWKNALDALEMAEKLDRNFAYTYAYRGLVLLAMGNPAGSVPEFQHALAIDPTLQPARDGLRQALQQPRAR